MRKLLPSILITIMALSVLSCAGIVSAQTPKATVQPQVIGPSTPRYYTVIAAVGNTYIFTPGQYNYYWTSLNRNLPGVVQATANPNTGNLYAYVSTKAYYAYESAEAVLGVNLYVKPPTAPTPTATTVTVTVVEKAAFQTQVANPFYAWGEMGTYTTYVYNSGVGYYYYSTYNRYFTTSNGKETTGVLPMTTTWNVNPAAGFDGWLTGNTYRAASYVNAQSVGGTTGTVSAQDQLQYIEIQFS